MSPGCRPGAGHRRPRTSLCPDVIREGDRQDHPPGFDRARAASESGPIHAVRQPAKRSPRSPPVAPRSTTRGVGGWMPRNQTPTTCRRRARSDPRRSGSADRLEVDDDRCIGERGRRRLTISARDAHGAARRRSQTQAHGQTPRPIHVGDPGARFATWIGGPPRRAAGMDGLEDTVGVPARWFRAGDFAVRSPRRSPALPDAAPRRTTRCGRFLPGVLRRRSTCHHDAPDVTGPSNAKRRNCGPKATAGTAAMGRARAS